MKPNREWAIRISVLAAAGLWLTLIAATWAESSEKSDEYNFSWLDPEKKIYVLQNRRYVKGNRLMLSGMLGTTSSSPYRTTYTVDPRIAYYFSEAFGIEGFYAFARNTENSTFENLKRSSPNALPAVREIRSQFGLAAHYVPWYAKINVFNNIIYFDWYFSGGAGTLNTALDTRTSSSVAASYAEENLFALFAGTGHHYHLGHNFSVRLDVTGAYYQAPLAGNSGAKIWFSNYTVGLGGGYKF